MVSSVSKEIGESVPAAPRTNPRPAGPSVAAGASLQCCSGAAEGCWLLGLALITTPIFIHLTFTRICEVQFIIKIITDRQFSLLHFVIF